MKSKNGLRWKQIGSLFMAVCMVLTMLPITAFAETGARDPGTPLGASGIITAFSELDTEVSEQTVQTGTPEDELNLPSALADTVAESVYAINNSALPIPGDVLQMESGVLKDGVLVFDLGDYDTFKASLTNGERFPITINRSKGGEAGYPVTAKLDSYYGSNDICFKIFDFIEGDDCNDGLIEFPPNVTSKTIYIGEEYEYGDNTIRSGTLSSYIYLYDFDKTTLATPMIRLETTKAKSTGVDTAGLPPVAYAQVGSATPSVKPGESKVISVTFFPSANIFQQDRGFCEITGDLTLNLKKGTETQALKPVEAVGSILSDVTFVIPPINLVDKEWEVVSITGIKNAANSDVIELTYSDDYGESDISVSSYTFWYDDEPVFGPVTTEKESYKGLENIQVSVPVQNADLINFGAEFNDYWRDQIGLSYDGGQSFIPQNSISWNSATKSIEATFGAPENNNGNAFHIAVEVYRSYGEMASWRGVFGAFKFIEISAETADFVPIESITVTGIPASGIVCDSPYPLNVDISPKNVTFPGYTWESSNPDIARVTGGNLVFYAEGKVTITLRSGEGEYRAEQGLPANDDVLVKTFTFFAGTPRLITGSISVGKSDTTTAVTARFNDNFDSYEDEWKTPVLTYEIRKADGTIVKSGNATRENDVTEVSLAFDDVTPKTVSPYESGEFKPAYTITLKATAGTSSVSATANVYITPPPVTMECLTETSNALVGEPATFNFRIKNLLPGYSSRYEITGGGGQEEGGLTNRSEESDPATELITLTGSVVFTPAVQGDVSEFRTITVYANNKDEKQQSISKRINIVNPSAALMSVKFYDGFDGTVINPEPGDKPDAFYGIRESRIAALTEGSTYNSEEVFKYLDRMMHTKTLRVAVPEEWGRMKAEGASLPAEDRRDISLYLSDVDKGKEITLSWENVNTQKKFSFNEDDLSGKVYAFRLLNALDEKHVSISYTNWSDLSVTKNVIPYNGYVIIYEPSGIKGEVWMSQEGAGYRFATFTQPRGISRGYRTSWYDLSPMVVSPLATDHGYRSQHPALAFTANTATMSDNPIAKFNSVGNTVPSVVRYCAIDKDRKIIAGTNGVTNPSAGSGNFELPFKALYENPNSQLMVEYEYTTGKEIRTQLEYYYLDKLEENLRLKKANSYAIVVSSYIQRLSVIGKDGVIQNFPVAADRFITINPGDIIELQLATASRAVKRAELKLLNHRRTVDANGNIGDWIFDYTKASPAVSIEEIDLSAFTPNKYTTLRFLPTREQMTLGCISHIRLVTVFGDGTSDAHNVCWGQMADAETAANIKKITDILNGQEFFHEKQMEFRLGDLNVKENTRNVKYEGSLFTFNEEVAAEIDKIKINLASPSKNPFTYEVKRKGDEYTIRGYANTDNMNKAGVVHLADRWKDATFDELFGETKRYVLQSSSKYRPNFPGIKGYVEGKAIITPSGDIRFTFHEGRTYVESDFFHKPKKLFDLSYYCSWTAVFEGMVTSIFEIKAPDNGGDPTVPFNFNLEESSWVFMNTRTAHNGISIDIGVYAVKVSLEGEIEDADYSRKSIHRPYATDSQKIQWNARFSTGGNLYERNYNRIITSPTDVDIESSNMKKWYSWFRKPGEEPFYIMHNIEATSSGWGSSKVSSFGMPSDFTGTDAYSQIMMVASADAFRLAARDGDSHRLDVDELSAVRYYNGGKGIFYSDSSSNIVTSGIDGNATETVDAKAFGIDIVSAENGSAVASWGSYKGNLDTDALDNVGKDGILKYASGKTEIKAGIFNGTNWSITTLTDNEMADITPKTAANGTEGVVVWTQGILNDYHLEGKLPVITFSESRLMYARYNGSAWGKPAVLYAPSGESIADYSVAMTDDGNALVTVVMGSGKIAIVRISKSGEVTVINNSLPTTTKASLVYNGKSYMLACSSDVKDAEGEDNGHIALTLYEISTDGFVTNTTFSGIPTDISGDFNLFRNWSESGAAVLVWRGSGKDNSEARITIYASKVSEANEDNTVLVSAPIAAANINLPTSTGPDGEGGAFTASYDAYIKGNDLKILTIFGESSSEESKSGESTPGESDRGVYLAETQAQFKNTIEIASCVNDISYLMPGLQSNFNIKVKNKGFVPITSINVKIGSGESGTNTVCVLPNDETAVTAAFIPTRDLPDSIDYTVTAVFSDGSESTVTVSVSLLQADIAAEILLFTQENGDYNIKALISNNTPFSLSGKTVIAGIYQDPFGTVPVTEEKIDGSKFENETLGTSLLVDFSFADAKDLPQSLYLIAKVYDSSGNEIPDNDSMNNILTVTNIVLVSSSSPGDDDDGSSSNPGDDDDSSSSKPGDNDDGSSSSGGSSSGITTTTITKPAKTPDQPVTAVAPVTATAGANGAASAAIPDKAITDAIAKAQADAKVQGKTASGISVGLNVNMPKGATALTASLTRSSLDSLVNAGVSQLELNGAPVSLSLDLKALQEIQKQSSGSISITIAPATGLSKEAKALLGNRPVYNITISYVKDGKTANVTSLGSGTATLSIPYTPGKNEAVGYLFGVYVDAKGKAQRIPGSAYDVSSGSLLIPTGHFSVYGVGYTAPSAKFTDIGNHWGKEAIDYVVGRGLLYGTSETTFAPNIAMTRGMLVTTLGRLAGVDAKTYTTNSFIDVKADSAFRPYIEWAYKKGVVQGIGNQRFAPDRAITREEIAVIFANYAKATGYKLPVTRKTTAYADDSSIGSVYKTAVKAMQQAGIMMGGSGNRFNPKSNATRAEVSSMLNRYIKLTIDSATAQGWALNYAGQWLYYKDGKPLTGTQTIDGVKYFFETTGVLKTGWVKDGDNWLYYSRNKAAIGWLDISDKCYYFTKDGLMVSGKWLQIDGKWYYFYADGALAKSTKVDGYEVDENGVRKSK